MLKQLKNTIENLLFANWYTLNYRGTRLKLSFNPRKGVCMCCNHKGLTNRHHWQYKYSRKQVMENNLLALNYTTELCFTCHQIANALRKLFENSPKATIQNPSVLTRKLINLRQKAFDEDEKWAKPTVLTKTIAKTVKKPKKTVVNPESDLYVKNVAKMASTETLFIRIMQKQDELELKLNDVENRLIKQEQMFKDYRGYITENKNDRKWFIGCMLTLLIFVIKTLYDIYPKGT